MRTKTLKVYMARVFTAIDVENPELLQSLADIRDRLDLGFKPVERQKMHLTLQFFSEADEEDIEQIKQAIDRTSLERFKAEVKGIGAFPSEDYIRVLWAGVDEENLNKLYEQVSKHTAKADNKYDFHPHITLMRVKNLDSEEKRKLKRMIKEHNDHKLGEISVNEVKLFRSDLSPEGSLYTEIYNKKL